MENALSLYTYIHTHTHTHTHIYIHNKIYIIFLTGIAKS